MPKLSVPFYVGAFLGLAVFVSGVLLSFPSQKVKSASPAGDDACPGGKCCTKCAPDLGELTFISAAVVVVAFVVVFLLMNRKAVRKGFAYDDAAA